MLLCFPVRDQGMPSCGEVKGEKRNLAHTHVSLSSKISYFLIDLTPNITSPIFVPISIATSMDPTTHKSGILDTPHC